MAEAATLRPILEPRSIAVIGASRDPNNIGHRVLVALLDAQFQGPVYPVNPKAAVVRCLRAYSKVHELPEPVDLAVICVPRDAVLPVVEECIAARVRGLVVITAGFAEVGPPGPALQEQLLAKVRGAGIRMVGPNCFGVLNTASGIQLNATFSPIYPPAGGVSMASQSGALGLAILAAARRLELGISQFVSVGNQADVASTDLLEYWEADPGTQVILLYNESFGEPRRFARIARRVSRQKPIVVLKSGRSGSGARAAGSHTAALAASDVAVEALCHQTGIIRAERLEEMFDLAMALSTQPLPRGRRVGVVTNAGGPAILCADACEAVGLTLPELSPALQARLASLLPATASVRNPIDMIASAGANHYQGVVQELLLSAEVDAVIVIYIPVGLSELKEVATAVESAVTAARASGKPAIPVLAIWMSDDAAPCRGPGRGGLLSMPNGATSPPACPDVCLISTWPPFSGSALKSKPNQAAAGCPRPRRGSYSRRPVFPFSPAAWPLRPRQQLPWRRKWAFRSLSSWPHAPSCTRQKWAVCSLTFARRRRCATPFGLSKRG
jgi:acetyl coenzyme A synthetase (ADP forming)-like protein